MGNLGKYQDIVTAAKRLGGVNNLIETIEAGAVAKAAPRLLRKGAAVGALLGAAGAAAGKHLWDKYKAREVAANEAKEQLKAEIEEHMNSDHANAEHGEDASDAGEGKKL